jgi:large subunit ribosomal protein L5e
MNQFETDETSLISRQQGDFVFCAASSSELPRYGVKHGLTNWTSAYATGLLCARRALKKLGLDEKYEGITEPDGEMTITEACKCGRDSMRCEEETRC